MFAPKKKKDVVIKYKTSAAVISVLCVSLTLNAVAGVAAYGLHSMHLAYYPLVEDPREKPKTKDTASAESKPVKLMSQAEYDAQEAERLALAMGEASKYRK